MQLRAPALVIPSAGRRVRPHGVRLLALLACRDEMRYLPGWIRNVRPHVDGIVVLDDGSIDGSAEFLADSDGVLEVIRGPRRDEWDEVGNHRRLLTAALAYEPDWFVSLDADERVEREFRLRAERVIRRGRPLGLSAYSVRLRELWGSRDRYRSDGVWGRKTVVRLYRARRDHAFDPRPWHGRKAPLQARRILRRHPLADLVVYHLRMVAAEDRLARRRRYEALDPQGRWQPRLGYAYLTEERGLRLTALPSGRDFVE
jgi:glycosyltransferase involved in cell wall biosynthesis